MIIEKENLIYQIKLIGKSIMAAQKRKQNWWQKFFAFLNVY